MINGILLGAKDFYLGLKINRLIKGLFEWSIKLIFSIGIVSLAVANHPIMKKILIIEDDLLISSMVQFRLRKDGYETIMVQDGNEGIKAIEEREIDLIITDVMMPFKSGIEIIHHAKKVKPNVPIIVLSSLGAEEQIVLEAFNLGVADFVPKPFNPNELAIRVKRVLNLMV